MKIEYNNPSSIDLEIPSEISKFLTEELENYIVVKNGYIISKKISDDFNDVYINDYNQALIEKAEVFEAYQTGCIHKNDAIIYNMENVNSGLLIHVPRNKTIADTLHVFYVSDQEDFVNNVTIVVEESAELNYFEYVYNTKSNLVNFFSKSVLKENSKLVYGGISKLNNSSKTDVNRVGGVMRYANLTFSIAELNDADTISNTFIKLNEEYAVGTTKTVAITSKEQKARFTQLVTHKAKFTEGFIENYGVSNNDSSLVFEGIGKINKGMKKSVARQSNKGIVLGAVARLDANPLLLIDEYDVVASHGAAIGKIDDEQLYYLMSRGLTLKNAERLIINGFLSPVLKLIKSDELIQDFVSSVENKTV